MYVCQSEGMSKTIPTTTNEGWDRYFTSNCADATFIQAIVYYCIFLNVGKLNLLPNLYSSPIKAIKNF